MNRLHDDAAASGEPVAYLWASEDRIYQRFGYGMATLLADVDLDREHAAFLGDPPPVGRVHLLQPAEARDVLPDIYEPVRRTRPGAFVRSAAWWEHHRLRDPPQERAGGSRLRCAVWEMDGAARAYAIWRVHASWTGTVPTGRVDVLEAVGVDPVATREIWRFLFGIDLAITIRAHNLPADHPLPFLLAEPRRLSLALAWPLWLRVLDVEAALEARRYQGDGAVVLEVADPLRPANDGCWRLSVSGGTGRCERSPDAPDLQLSAGDLGAVYLGGTPFAGLLAAGRIVERTEDAAARADALFRSPLAPWCPEIF